MISRTIKRLKSSARRLNRDISGMSFIYVTLSLPVILGMGLLAIDVGRVTSLQSSLQHGADALALAGANELDLRPDAITRANRAVDNLITSNTSLFANSVVTINGAAVTRCYLETIPASDTTPITQPCLDPVNAASASLARFLRVTVNPQTFNTIFPATFLGAASDSSTSSAEAVAGFQAAVCKFTPMFICNPFEPADNTDVLRITELNTHFSTAANRRRLINMKQTGGNTAQYFPGNFGWLVPQGGSQSASVLRQQVGMQNPPACFVSRGVELRTGNIESVRFGFNTRFDMYDGPMNGEKNNPVFRPAKYVRKGMRNDKSNGQGSACNPQELDRNLPPANAQYDDAPYLFRDNCFYTNTCPNMGGRMGDGEWDHVRYWTEAHPGMSPPNLGATPSRYDYYKHEVTSITPPDDSLNPGDGGEIGLPQCYTGAPNTITASPDRRVFYSAVLNCRALDSAVNGGPIQGGSSNLLPVVSFAKFFLTEPVGGDKGNANTADGDVWAEMFELALPGQADNVARDIVQLYR